MENSLHQESGGTSAGCFNSADVSTGGFAGGAGYTGGGGIVDVSEPVGGLSWMSNTPEKQPDHGVRDAEALPVILHEAAPSGIPARR